MALVIRDKPLTLGRLRSSVIYRLGAVPRGDVSETYVDPAVAEVDSDIADLENVVLNRLELQDDALRQLEAATAAVREGMSVMARQMRIACDGMAHAAETAERLSETVWRPDA